jgi:cytoskeletal protein CcmA (bactofilin family)
MPESRVTIGRNGKVDASIQAREVVVMGKVTGNIECSDRVDIRPKVPSAEISQPFASAWKMAPR